ncbi:c-type cytochrome [Tritonibacter scottomollicae]|uniref:C-type cytochrome n=1 Tax=Tritonibacter scottomollicae TaxID=483013 RepID=A0ABZ0HCY6_TRISK|nr:c-type cytochrome [Tritonibacter scottomollicae]WOI32683.1 c-type cytochrome [Tritonibacter scottomollicae]
MKRILTTAALVCLAMPALAEGDAEKGEKAFNKCKSCHQIVSDTDETIVRGGRTGPNLWGIAGRQAGTVEDFRYGDDLVAAGEAGLVWDEAKFVAYVQDPRGFLKEELDDSGAKSKMSFRVKKGGEDVYAYLAQFGPAEAAADDAATATD